MRKRGRLSLTRMGRKPKGFKLMTFRLPIDIRSKIDAVLARGETRSSFIRAAIEAAVAARAKRKRKS